MISELEGISISSVRDMTVWACKPIRERKNTRAVLKIRGFMESKALVG